MKKILFFAIAISLLISCGIKVPFSNELRDEFILDTDEKMRDVQFLISHSILLDQELISDSLNTTENGTLISSSNRKKERIIINAHTKCIFENFGKPGEIIVRFETGEDKTLIFSCKSEGNRNKWYSFDADWSATGGPKIQYGGNIFKVNSLMGSARYAHLLVVKKNLQKNKRKKRVVKGLKV